jgi:hypothetical protein
MRRATCGFITALLLAVSVGVLASDSILQPSYDALMAMSAEERRSALRGMDEAARMALFRTHIDRWLEQNRSRLSSSQIALLTDVRNSLTPEQRDVDRTSVLERRMRCELWRSDLIAVTLPHRDQMSSSWLGDVAYWVDECVISKVIDAVF